MSIEQLLHDYGIPFITEGHKHCTKGWINIHCPFCSGSQDYHLGINKSQLMGHCWRCGGHSIIKTLSQVLNMNHTEAKQILSQYDRPSAFKKELEDQPKVSIHPFKFPQPTNPLNNQGKKYLTMRKFDPDKLEKEWNLKQTGPISTLDMVMYNNRILIPIYWNKKIVSFQTRDFTGTSDKKYLACPMKREIIHHKNIVYGRQEQWGKKEVLIIVEGVTDVWRLGEAAVATFGTSFKMEQVLQLSNICDKFFIVFDNEEQAQEQAKKLAVKLKMLGKKVFVETVDKDPGDMDQENADYFVKNLIKKRGM